MSKKVIRKSKADRRKRVRKGRGIVARTIRFLDRWHTWAQTDKHKHGEGVAIMEFIAAHVKPSRERGDQYLQTLMNIVNGTPELVTKPEGVELDELPGKIKEVADHLRELRDDRLNYDDMREALEALHLTGWNYFWPWNKQYLLDLSGASKALIGAPVSDSGAMRRTLQLADNELSAAINVMDEKTPREAVLAIWKVIHAARAALKAKVPAL